MVLGLAVTLGFCLGFHFNLGLCIDLSVGVSVRLSLRLSLSLSAGAGLVLVSVSVSLLASILGSPCRPLAAVSLGRRLARGWLRR